MAHRTVGVGQTIRLSGTATTSTAFKVQSNVKEKIVEVLKPKKKKNVKKTKKKN